MEEEVAPTCKDQPIVIRAQFDMERPIRQIFMRHGCQIQADTDYLEITFPAGTSRRKQLPKTLDDRFILSLPDGWIVVQVCVKGLEYSILLYQRESS
ncbi:hypothetical protein EPA93_00230 [Ktedonosporobacter rubrisoli]|uniref:Uncharacterized protein n=1 Tax=Ktedonosporobacter rubrisoli TaxID=2509675 RepID=A0A4P6JHL1_KTERU|nr:hypothetical protein [Ktedonosporobacter rubrisoli]QBD74504.1 hypothetical protein EPA93_00230 [Ktedonosporobacter rubrisoli]